MRLRNAPPLLVDTGVIIGFMHVRCSIRAFSARHVVGDKNQPQAKLPGVDPAGRDRPHLILMLKDSYPD